MCKKEPIQFREVKRQELSRRLFKSFERRQAVTDCFRMVKGKWTVQPAPFVDQWSEEDYEFLVTCLKGTAETGGVVFGAFSQGALKGFACVDARPKGKKGQYLDLCSLHVSEEMRGQGIGQNLFAMAAAWAKEHGAKKLYISSHSAMETQRFYEAMGCKDAMEPLEEHVNPEPYDRQLELDLAGWKDHAKNTWG